MGIEWYRDLSITILGIVASVVLIFGAILGYRLYRTLNSTLLMVKGASKIAYDTVLLVQEGIKPLLSIFSLIQGLVGGLGSITRMFKKESNNKGENCNE
jgi:hypothetical protein